MKRLVLMAGLLTLAFAVVASTAAAHNRHHDPFVAVTYCVDGIDLVVESRDDHTLVGDVTYADAAEAGGYYTYQERHQILFWWGQWHEVTALDEPSATWGTQFRYVVFHAVSDGTCSVASPAERPANGVFLCYSSFQDQPGMWPEPEARALFAEGYWLPFAVAGKQVDGTNVGGFHLSCNVAATQSVSDTLLGGDGTVLGALYKGNFGLYPVVGG